MVVAGRKETLEEKQFYTGIGSWCSKYPVQMVVRIEVRCACRVSCSWKCLRIVFSAGVEFSEFYESVEFVERLESLVTEIAPELPLENRFPNRLEFVQDVRNTGSLDGGLLLLPIVVAARVFETLRILTGTAVCLVGLKRARILSINLSHKADIPPC